MCSGLLVEEAAEVSAAFVAAGFREVRRREEVVWAAVLLRRR
jgi:ribosomal protein L11 methylase PrmA